MKTKVIFLAMLVTFSGEASAHSDFWLGLGAGALLFSPPVYVAPPPQYYYPPPQYYPPPREYYNQRHCYPIDVGGYYNYRAGRYLPNMQWQCD